MTTYRLPDGAEVRAADNLAKTATLANHTWVIHPTLGAISCYTGLLTEVKPPLSAEPPAPAHALVEAANAVPEVWVRQFDGEWWQIGGEYQRFGRDWEQLHERGKVTVLVPDPADQAPELPLKLHSQAGDWLATVQPSAAANGLVFMEVESTDYKPAVAREIAAAIWRAAREVEQS